MREPTLILNGGAIAAAVVAAFFLGFLWYGPLFGRTWAKLMGIKIDKKPETGMMLKSMGLQALGLFLTAYVVAHTCQVWRASVWGVGDDGPSWMYGVYCAFFTWIGFYIPQQLGKVAWEKRPWKLFVLNAGHDLAVLLVISEILAIWR